MTKPISIKQMKYSAAAFIIAYSLLSKSLFTYTDNQAWMPIVIATIISFLIISIYGRLSENYPYFNLIEINEAVFGTVLGKAVSVLYVFFFLTLTIFNMRDIGNFIKNYLLPSTPITLIYTIFIFICSMAVRKGAHVITRYGTLATVIVFAVLILNALLLVNKMRMENFLPVFTVPLKNYLIGAHLVAMLPFCEIFAFMLLNPYLQKPGEMGKALKPALLIGAISLLFIILRDIAVLGDYSLVSTAPTFSSIRLIDVGDILTRLEIVYAVVLMSLMFFKISILYFAAAKGLSSIFRIDQHDIFVSILGVLTVVYANAIFLSSFEQLNWFRVAATYAFFFLLLLPLVALIISEIKKKANKEQSGAAVRQQ